MTANSGIKVKSPLLDEEYILREVGSVAQAEWGVMPAPLWWNYLGRDLGKGKRHLVLISGLAHCEKYYFSERPRSPMAARGALPAQERSDSQEA